MFEQLITRMEPLRRLPMPVRYLLATCIVLGFFFLRAQLSGPLANYPFLLFFPAVIIVSLLLDRGTGVFAAVLSSALAWYFFVEPKGSASVRSLAAVLPTIIYFATSLFLAAVIEALRVTVTKLSRTSAELARADGMNRLLLMDINHRVKNHLQSITALLRLSERDVEDVKARAALEQAAGRIAVLGKVYDRLHLGQAATAVSSRDFMETLCADLRNSVIGLRPIALRARITDVELTSSQAVALGLVINELVENAIKYAFPSGAGDITVSFAAVDDARYRLTVSDTGVGMPGAAAASERGTGGRLVRSLAQQLGGELSMESDAGLTVTLVFPIGARL